MERQSEIARLITFSRLTILRAMAVINYACIMEMRGCIYRFVPSVGLGKLFDCNRVDELVYRGNNDVMRLRISEDFDDAGFVISIVLRLKIMS